MPFIKAYYVKLQTLVIQHIGFKTSVLFLKDFAFNYGYVCRYIGRGAADGCELPGVGVGTPTRPL